MKYTRELKFSNALESQTFISRVYVFHQTFISGVETEISIVSTTLICWVVSNNFLFPSSLTTIFRFEIPVLLRDSKRNSWYHSITLAVRVSVFDETKPIEFHSIEDSIVSLSHTNGFQNLSNTVITFVVTAQFDSSIFEPILVSIFEAISGWKNNFVSIFCPLLSIISNVISHAWVIPGSWAKRSKLLYSNISSNINSCLELIALTVIGYKIFLCTQFLFFCSKLIIVLFSILFSE